MGAARSSSDRGTRRAASPSLDLLERAPIPVVAIDADLTLVFVNSATREAQVGDALGTQLDAAERAELRHHARRWLGGELYPVRIVHATGGAAQRYLALPVRLSGASEHLAICFQPAEPIEAALAGKFDHSAELALAWERLRGLAASEAGFDVSREQEAAFARLSPREWEVARRLVVGGRVRGVAEELQISHNTVRNHLKAVFRKLGVNSQTELVRRLRSALSAGVKG